MSANNNNDDNTNSKFQLNAKNICLTYPRCPLSITDTLAQLKSIFPTAKYIITCSETHQDGGLHVHAGIALDKACRTRNQHFADLRSGNEGGSIYHPNVQSARRFSAWVEYIKKDGNFLEFGSMPNNKSNNDITQEELINTAKTMEFPEFLAFCSVNKLTYAKQIWEAFHTDKALTLTLDDKFEGVIDERFSKLINDVEFHPNLTLLLVGKSGIGKTTWAKQTIPKPCLFVTHLDDLKKFRIGYHISILFDDVSFNHLPETSQIHLLDFENPRSIHIRHTIARVPSGIRKIITCNTIPVSYHIEAISRRSQLLQCHEYDLAKY